MDGNRFDELVRAVADGPSRRSIVKGVAGGGLAALLAGIGLGGFEADGAKSCRKKCKKKKGAAKRRCKQRCKKGNARCRDLGQTCGPRIGACCGAQCTGADTRICVTPGLPNGGLSVDQITNLLGGTLNLAELADILGDDLDLSVLDLETLGEAVNDLTALELAELLNDGVLDPTLFDQLLGEEGLIDLPLLAELLNEALLDQDVLDDLLGGNLDGLLEGDLGGLLEPGLLCQLLPVLPVCP